MSTEQQPATQQPATPHPSNEPKQEPTALAAGLANAWSNFAQGKLLSYPMMAILLLVIAGIGGGWWYFHEQAKASSARWRKWDEQNTVAGLQEFAKENPNTIQAKLADLRIAQIHLESEGISKMFVRSEDLMRGDVKDPFEAAKKAQETRDTAVKNVETAREEFKKLVDDFKDDPVIKVQCMLACAKAEAVLVGIPKPGQLTERRGDPAKAVEWLDKVAEAAPDTPWGKDSKKLADVLRNQNTKEQVATLHASLFDISPGLPTRPGGFPGMPKDAIHGFPGP